MQQTIENLEELARTQQQQIAAHARSTASYQTSVIERDEIIADKSKLLRSQNEIIAGLHELRRREVGEISATMLSLLQTLNMKQVTITDERLAYAQKRFHGAHYSLTRHRDDERRETIFAITQTEGPQS